MSRLMRAGNAVAVVERKSKSVVRLLLNDHGDDSRLPCHRSNDQKYEYTSEDDHNIRGVWALRRLMLV